MSKELLLFFFYKNNISFSCNLVIFQVSYKKQANERRK
ncbi:hypothetical protein HMPREF9182_0911 [Streptococcus sp. oral taxon 056 str. F0418]|nr:hypothetical protein HMPREF9182_0911 [Streptococcus sp. oral taxon 056 str. F0418]